MPVFPIILPWEGRLQHLTQGLEYTSYSIYICRIEVKFYKGLWRKVKRNKARKRLFLTKQGLTNFLQFQSRKRRWIYTVIKAGG